MNILFIIQHLSDSLKHVEPNMAVLPLAVPIALSALSSLPNWISGFKQKQQANELQKSLVRPDFQIPESAQQALQSARNQAGMTRLPGQSAVEGSLNQNTANQLDTIERMGPGGATSLNAAGQVYGNQQKGINDLGIAAASNWNQNQAGLRDQLGRMSEWEYQQWNWDKKLPYENKAAAIRSLNEGSMRNLDNAAKDLFGGAANIAMSAYIQGNQSKMMQDYLNGMKTNIPPPPVTPTMPESNLTYNNDNINVSGQNSANVNSPFLAGLWNQSSSPMANNNQSNLYNFGGPQSYQVPVDYADMPKNYNQVFYQPNPNQTPSGYTSSNYTPSTQLDNNNWFKSIMSKLNPF